MKRLYIILTVLFLLIGCNDNDETNENVTDGSVQESPPQDETSDKTSKDNQDKNSEPNEEAEQLPTLDKMQVIDLMSQLEHLMNPKLDDNESKKVVEYETKIELINELTIVAEEKLATDFVNEYFVDQGDGLYQKNFFVPSLIDQNQPFELRKQDENHFVVTQSGNDEFPRNTEVKFVFNEKAWKVLSIKKEPVEAIVTMEEIKDPLNNLVLVNKNFGLPVGFKPPDLVIPDVTFSFTEDLPKKQMREEAAVQLEKMFIKASEDNINLFAQSGFRSYARQEAIFAYNANKFGEEQANKYSARPGESEHQTGLAMDVTSRSINFQLIEEFGETKEGKWIEENGSQFGFIIRYPKGKEHITGYIYEPWHLRYVGQEVALYINNKQITLEEFIEENKTVILGN